MCVCVCMDLYTCVWVYRCVYVYICVCLYAHHIYADFSISSTFCECSITKRKKRNNFHPSILPFSFPKFQIEVTSIISPSPLLRCCDGRVTRRNITIFDLSSSREAFQCCSVTLVVLSSLFWWLPIVLFFSLICLYWQKIRRCVMTCDDGVATWEFIAAEKNDNNNNLTKILVILIVTLGTLVIIYAQKHQYNRHNRYRYLRRQNPAKRARV